MSLNGKPKQTPGGGGGGPGGGIGGQRRGSWRGPAPNGGHGHQGGPRGGGAGGGGSGGGGTSGMVRLGSSPNTHQGLRTDSDISRGPAGNNNPGRMRDLQPWGSNAAPHHQHQQPHGHQQQQQPGGGPGMSMGSPSGPGGSAFPALGSQPPASIGRKGAAPSPSPSTQTPLAGLINAMSNNNVNSNSPTSASPSPAQTKSQKDAETFGDLASEYNNGSIGQWDQFATNAKLFGTKTDYDEGLYTTTIKKGSGREWEQKLLTAERLEKEILGGKTDNTHVAEERGQVIANGNGEEMDEEDKYSGVKRKTAYVPPALRRLASGTPSEAPATATPAPTAQPEKKDNKDVQTQAQVAAPATTASTATPEKPATKTARGGKVVSTETKQEATPAVASPVPVLNVTAADGETPKKEGRTPEKLRTGAARGSQAIKGDIQGFVEHEKEKLQKQRETMAKAERERKLADLKKFGATFKIPGAKPADLPVGGSQKTSPNVSSAKPVGGAPSVQPTPKTMAAQPVAAAPKAKIKMVIPEIPPFHRAAQPKPEAIAIEPTADVTVPQVKVDESNASIGDKSADVSAAVSPAGTIPKLNPGASTFVFKPNPKAVDFKPSGAPVDAKSPPAAPAMEIPPLASASAAAVVPARNPFFGLQVPKRNGMVNLREDFNPFKGKVVEARNIPVNWPFAGKKFLAALHPTGAYMTAPPLGMEEDPMHGQGHLGGPIMNQFAMGPNGPFPPYRVQHQGGFPVPGSPGQPGMVNGHFAPPYGPGGGFYVPQGGPVMGGPGTPNGFPQGLPPFANNPGNQSPMMVANAMLRPAGNPVYYVQPPGMSHPASPHHYPATPQSVISNHPGGPPNQGGPGPGPGPNP